MLRIWCEAPDFIRFYCARCGISGGVGDERTTPLDPGTLARFRADRDRAIRASAAKRLDTARWLWAQRRPPGGTVVETYLRARGYLGPIPRTIGFLPAAKGRPRLWAGCLPDANLFG